MPKLQTLLDLVDRFEPFIKAAFRQAIANIKSDAVLSVMAEALANGDINAALKASGITEAAMRPLVQAIERAYEAGGIFTADQIKRPIGGAKFRFDIRDSATEASLRDYSSQLITRLTDDIRAGAREVLSEGMRLGQGPATVARDLVGTIGPSGAREGGLIGLSQPQAQWVKNMEQDLINMDERYFSRTLRDQRFDSTVRKAFDAGTPLSQDTIDGLTQKYSNRLLQSRGTTIARTETISTLNQSQQDAIVQATNAGGVDQSAVTREWDATEHVFIDKPGHTRKTHVEMDGQKRGMNEPFVSSSGARMMYPGDTSLGAPAEETINCRCRLKITVDWLKGFT